MKLEARNFEAYSSSTFQSFSFLQT